MVLGKIMLENKSLAQHITAIKVKYHLQNWGSNFWLLYDHCTCPIHVQCLQSR